MLTRTLTAVTSLALAALMAAGLAGCASDDGATGLTGATGPTGPQGPAGPPAPPPANPAVPNVANADVVFPTITGVTIASKPVVSFRLVDSKGLPLQGLQASQVRFAIAKLTPGSGGGSSQWKSYINRTVNPAPGFDGTQPAVQANTETATAGVFTDNADGTYSYQFSFDVAAVAGIPYDPTLTHRVALQISLGSVPVDNNASYTWQPSSGATAGIFTREIVDNDTCNACHDGLAFHGGGRKDTQYCVMCHNPGSTDPESTNTVDMKAMIHNIHAGAEGGKLPYYIVGYNNTVYDFSTLEWTQDIRNCQTCHEESDTDTPDASNWRKVTNAASCGTCHHSNVNFVTGEGHAVGAANDASCDACHGPDSTVAGGSLRTEIVHRIPTVEAAKKFQFNVLSVTNTAPGQFPVVNFSVTDPTNGDAPYNILADSPFVQCAGGASRLAIDIGWNTANYTNGATTFTPGLPVQLSLLACPGQNVTPVQQADGSFTVTSPVAVPAFETGSLVATLEGHPAVDADPNIAGFERIAVSNAFMYAGITDATPVPRRQKVDVAKCDECHKQLSLHGNNRTDRPQVCVVCHAPNATDIAQRAGACGAPTALGPDDQAIDMKYMIHRIHSSGATGIPYGVCGFNSSVNLFDVTYVGKLNNCEGCHVADGYYPVDSTLVAGTTFDANDRSTFNDDAVTSPNAAACSGCHQSSLATAHMGQNGGYFKRQGVKDAVTGKMIPGGDIETCALCHGPGKSNDIRDAHGIGAFEVYNVRDNN